MRSLTTIAGIMFILVLFPGCGKEDVKIEEARATEPLAKKKIILLVGDGMGLSQISAASVANGQLLNMEKCKYVGLQKAFSADNLLSSSASSITAMACGVKTNYEFVGVDPDQNPVKNIVEILKDQDYSAGIVTSSFVTDATPAGFYAHNADRYNREAIALDLIRADMDVVIGGGRDHFNNRTDGLNLLDSLSANGYQVFDQLEPALQIQTGKVACFTSEFKPPRMSEGRGNMLSDATELAIKLLDENDNGFFLMVEGAQIDWACHANEQDYMIDELLDFDKAIGKVLDYAQNDGNTLVIITGDHETAGYAIVGGIENTGEVFGEFVSDSHTATMVPVFAYGPGASAYSGVYHNTAFFDRFLNFYKLSNP